MPDDAMIREARQERLPVHAPCPGTPAEITARYLTETLPGQRIINFGCGGMTFRDGLNIDRESPHHAQIVYDLNNGMPFLPDSQFDAVFSEAFLEHLTRKAAMLILQDSFRALKPGGHVRIAIPDLALFIFSYFQRSTDRATSEAFREEYGAVFNTPCEFFNIATRGWGHTYMYDREEIDTLFKHVGFVDVKRAPVRYSDVPLLHNRENRPETEISLITEGCKPG